MAVRKIHLSSGTLFITLLIAGFILLWLPQSLTCNLNFLFLRIFDPLLRLGRQVEREGSRTRPVLQESIDAAEYNKLKKSYQNLLEQYRTLHKEFETLSRVRKEVPLPWSGLVLAQITSSTRGIRHELVLNKGSGHGLAPGQMVLAETHDSVIGVVQEASARMARVRLLTDPAQNLEVRIRRSGTDQEYAARLTGDGKTACRILLLSRDYDIRQGDIVYAAPRPGILEAPLVIGECSQVRPDDEHPLLWDITVKPYDDAFAQTVVAVIVPPAAEFEKKK
jgi:cell shape-determining protein MreC